MNRLTQGRLRQIIKEELSRAIREAEKKSKEVSDDPDEMNEMDMMGDEEEEFARRPSEQLLDLEKYVSKIMNNQRLATYSREGGFSVTDVVDLYAREMARDLEEMGVEPDDRTIHEEVHDMLDILAVEGELNLDPENPDMYTFVRMPKMRRLGPR